MPSAFAWRPTPNSVPAVDHRLALGSRPALPSAPDIEAGTVAPVGPRKPCEGSFSSVSSPIFACSVFTSRAGVASARATAQNTPDAPSRSCERHCVIWFGWTSNCSASSASVFSPRMAAKATQSSGKRSPGSFSDPPHALKARLWFRRGRLLMGLSSLPAIMPMSRGQSTHRPRSVFPSRRCRCGTRMFLRTRSIGIRGTTARGAAA